MGRSTFIGEYAFETPLFGPLTALTPIHFGAVSGDGGDHTAAFTALWAAIDADATKTAIDLAGVWNVDGGLPTLTRNDIKFHPSGYAKITRTADGTLFKFTGDRFVLTGLEVRGGAFSDDIIEAKGPSAWITHNDLYDGLDNGITLQDDAAGSMVMFNRITDTGGASIGLGATPYCMVMFNECSDSGPEIIQANGGTKSIVAFNNLHGGGGVGNFGGTGLSKMMYLANMSRDGNSGLKIGSKTEVNSAGNIAAFNMLFNNEKDGLNLQNYYREEVPTAITRASPAVVTFGRATITGADNGNPITITAVAHGIQDKEIKQINGIVGMTGLNGEMFRIHKVDNDNVMLLDPDTGAGINGGPKGTYGGGGFIDHGFIGDRGYASFSGVVGMVELNGEDDAHIRSRTATTITLEHGDGTDFDTSAYTAFVYDAGALAYVGSMSTDWVIVGNLAANNGRSNYLIGDEGILPGYANNSIYGNVSIDAEDFFFDAKGSSIQNQQIAFSAVLAADVASATGDGTNYVLLCDEVDDLSGIYDPTNGKATMPRSGVISIDGAACVKVAAGATSAYLDIRHIDPFNIDTLVARVRLFPDIGDVAQSRWSNTIHKNIPVQKGATIRLRVVVAGLGAGVVGLDSSNGGCAFSGIFIG